MDLNQHDEQGRRTGRWEERFTDGSVSGEGAYADGEKCGPWRYYLKGGALKAAGSYRAGKLVGHWFWARATGGLL